MTRLGGALALCSYILLFVASGAFGQTLSPKSSTETKIPVYQNERINQILPLYGIPTDTKTISTISAANPMILTSKGEAKSDGYIKIPVAAKPRPQPRGVMRFGDTLGMFRSDTEARSRADENARSSANWASTVSKDAMKGESQKPLIVSANARIVGAESRAKPSVEVGQVGSDLWFSPQAVHLQSVQAVQAAQATAERRSTVGFILEKSRSEDKTLAAPLARMSEAAAAATAASVATRAMAPAVAATAVFGTPMAMAPAAPPSALAPPPAPAPAAPLPAPAAPPSAPADHMLAYAAPTNLVTRICDPLSGAADCIPSVTNLAPSPYRFVDEDLQQDIASPVQCKSGPDAKLPFDVDSIARKYDKVRKTLSVSPSNAIVLIADTGLASSGISRNIWTNPGDIETGYGDDLHGANMVVGNGNIEPSAKYKYAWHGAEVLHIMTDEVSRRSELADAFRVAVAKVTKDDTPFDIYPQAIQEAFIYARSIRADVLNLSVVANNAPPPGLGEGLQAASFVVVSAAGNNGKDVERVQIFPPAFNKGRELLLVVGANDWQKGWATFSNWGLLVDLFAPGCAVPTMGPDGKILVYGTSFAAPFVSVTAALLRSLHLTPRSTKNRIMASVDFDPDLASRARSGGTLNIENALEFNQDILILRGDHGKPGPPMLGEISPNDRWVCDGKDDDGVYAPHTVTRIVTGYPGDGGAKMIEVQQRAEGSPTTRRCTKLTNAVHFRVSGDEPYVNYNWENIWSVVPRCRSLGRQITMTC